MPRLVPGAAVACSVVWVAGSGPWLVGPPPAGMWGHPGLLSGWFWWAWLVLYLFMSRGCGDDMTCRDFLEIFSPDSLFTGGVGRAGRLDLPQRKIRGRRGIRVPQACAVPPDQAHLRRTLRHRTRTPWREHSALQPVGVT